MTRQEPEIGWNNTKDRVYQWEGVGSELLFLDELQALRRALVTQLVTGYGRSTEYIRNSNYAETMKTTY